MQCQAAQELFSDYVSQDLERAMALSLENHIGACSRCKEELAVFRQTWEALNALPQVEPPMFFHENLMSRIAAEQAKAEEATATRRAVFDWRALFRPRQLAFASTVLIMLFAGVEFVVVRSGFDGPLTMVGKMIWPASPIAPAPIATGEWVAAPQGGGTLLVHLTPAKGTPNSGLNYTITVNGDAASAQAGLLSNSREAVATFTLPAPPSSVSLSFGRFGKLRTMPIPVHVVIPQTH